MVRRLGPHARQQRPVLSGEEGRLWSAANLIAFCMATDTQYRAAGVARLSIELADGDDQGIIEEIKEWSS